MNKDSAQPNQWKPHFFLCRLGLFNDHMSNTYRKPLLLSLQERCRWVLNISLGPSTFLPDWLYHFAYSDVIMSTMASQITDVSIVLLNRLFRRRLKNTPKLRVTRLCEGNSPVIGEFPAQRASNAEMFPFDDVIMGWYRVQRMQRDTCRLTWKKPRFTRNLWISAAGSLAKFHSDWNILWTRI